MTQGVRDPPACRAVRQDWVRRSLRSTISLTVREEGVNEDR